MLDDIRGKYLEQSTAKPHLAQGRTQINVHMGWCTLWVVNPNDIQQLHYVRPHIWISFDKYKCHEYQCCTLQQWSFCVGCKLMQNTHVGL